MDTELFVKICTGAMVVGSIGFVVSSIVLLENSFEIIDEYKKELARTQKTNKESEEDSFIFRKN